MKLKVLKPTAVLIDEMVENVSIPTRSGEIKILPRHENLQTLLTKGAVKINGQKRLSVERGVVKVEHDSIFIFLDENANIQKAKSLLEEAKELAGKGIDGRELPHELIEIEKEIKYELNKRALEESF